MRYKEIYEFLVEFKKHHNRNSIRKITQKKDFKEYEFSLKELISLNYINGNIISFEKNGIKGVFHDDENGKEPILKMKGKLILFLYPHIKWIIGTILTLIGLSLIVILNWEQIKTLI